eukprot:354396-Chlamydomonas_euryale.AAC.3
MCQHVVRRAAAAELSHASVPKDAKAAATWTRAMRFCFILLSCMCFAYTYCALGSVGEGSIRQALGVLWVVRRAA